ncbi:MAG: imidazolonepropionase [Desulfobacteraceae bacterium]
MGESGYDLYVNAHLATMTPGREPYGRITQGAVAVQGGRIAWVGRQQGLPRQIESAAHNRHDCHGAWITPGLIDCHTHLVHGGSRAKEFELRLQGATYEELARRGGGIAATVNATRAASEESLFEQSVPRLRSLLAEGVTTVEVKSGYGLDMDTELRMLRVARALGKSFPVRVLTSYLGAHALPSEYRDRPDEYIELVTKKVMPMAAAEGLADMVDVFCERIAFSRAQAERVFQAARDLNLPVKVHAEQLSDQGAAALGAKYGALSADHLEHLSEEGVREIANSGTRAVLLPGAFYFLKDEQKPPVELLRKYLVPMAVATDMNPGSSPAGSLLLMLNMACVLFSLTPEEALAGVTREAAGALGLAEETGTLEPGKAADFVLWDIMEPAELAYRFGFNPCAGVVQAGVRVL